MDNRLLVNPRQRGDRPAGCDGRGRHSYRRRRNRVLKQPCVKHSQHAQKDKGRRSEQCQVCSPIPIIPLEFKEKDEKERKRQETEEQHFSAQAQPLFACRFCCRRWRRRCRWSKALEFSVSSRQNRDNIKPETATATIPRGVGACVSATFRTVHIAYLALE